MPEEINRLLTDAVADLLLVSEPSGVDEPAARRRGRLEDQARRQRDDRHAAGPAARRRERAVAKRLGLTAKGYGLVTLHRPSNVDDPATLGRSSGLLARAGARAFPSSSRAPAHARGRRPRRDRRAWRAGPRPAARAFRPSPTARTCPCSSDAAVVLTDSGGLQEESAVLGVPCLTMRDNTERPVTVELGTSRLVGNDPERIRAAFADVLAGRWPKGRDDPALGRARRPARRAGDRGLAPKRVRSKRRLRGDPPAAIGPGLEDMIKRRGNAGGRAP